MFVREYVRYHTAVWKNFKKPVSLNFTDTRSDFLYDRDVAEMRVYNVFSSSLSCDLRVSEDSLGVSSFFTSFLSADESSSATYI